MFLAVFALSVSVVAGPPAGATIGVASGAAAPVVATQPGSPGDSVADQLVRGRACTSHLGGGLMSAIHSQNFEPSYDAFDSVAADDFRVSTRCRARYLRLVGEIGGSVAYPHSEQVTFYRNDGGKPGKVIRSDTVVGEFSDNGTVEITLDPPARLRPGRTYWLSVQADMDFEDEGQWWVYTRGDIDGNHAVWQNPGDGFDTGCVDWTPIGLCAGDPWDGDLVFEIRTR